MSKRVNIRRHTIPSVPITVYTNQYRKLAQKWQNRSTSKYVLENINKKSYITFWQNPTPSSDFYTQILNRQWIEHLVPTHPQISKWFNIYLGIKREMSKIFRCFIRNIIVHEWMFFSKLLHNVKMWVKYKYKIEMFYTCVQLSFSYLLKTYWAMLQIYKKYIDTVKLRHKWTILYIWSSWH